MALHITGDPEADALISRDPLALLIGMVLDQQVPLEWAFAGPAELKRRLGGCLDPREIAAMDPGALVAVFTSKPALHRYPASMAQRVQDLCKTVAEEYGGAAQKLWEEADSGRELLRRLKDLPGFGDQKARIFVALLGKQLGIQPDGWEQAGAPFSEGGATRSVADIVDAESLARVRAYKQQMKQKAKQAPPKAAPGKVNARAGGR